MQPFRQFPHGIGIYVHLPFCRVKCSYCGFAISTRQSLGEPYLRALEREVELWSERLQADGLTLYFGGGTPSLTPPSAVARLIRRIDGAFPPRGDRELTLEANPEDVTATSLSAWCDAGINRISLGIQSFHDDELRPLGRAHGREGALRALELISGTELRLSLDLIAGLPGQTRERFDQSLDLALGSGAGHLSIYLLDLEERSALDRRVRQGLVALPDEDEVVEMWLSARQRCQEAGIEPYEVSNYARPGEQSRHNRSYWDRTPYLGLGLGAHSFFGSTRLANPTVIGEYIVRLEEGRDPTVFEETIGSEEERHERLLLGLRQTRGMETSELVRLAGKGGIEWKRRGLSEGWLEERQGSIAFTPRGFLLSNDLLSELF